MAPAIVVERFVVEGLAIFYLFGRRPFKTRLIDGCRATLPFTLYGAVLGAMG